MTVPSSLNTPNATASSNDPQGSEAVFPSLDDYIRAYASFIAQIRDHQHEYLSTVAGTVDAITGTTSSGAPNALSAGQVFWFKAHGANTSDTPTININTIGSKTIKRQDGSALVAGDIPGAGKIVLLGYDGTDMIYLNCPRVTKADVATTATTATTATSATTSTYAPQIQVVSSSVAGNALTVGYSGGVLDFRSATATSGAITAITVVPLSLTVPAGATLGTTSGQSARIAIIAINNAGTVEIAVCNLSGGVNLDETSLISTTAISAAATSASVVYSNTARTNVAFRVVGFIDITEATAGTWATAPTLVQGCGGQALTALSSFGYGQTWQDVRASRAFGTTYYNTTGKPILVSVGANSSASNGYLSATVDAVTVAVSTASFSWTLTSLSFIVPPGQSYRVDINNTSVSSLQCWSELR